MIHDLNIAGGGGGGGGVRFNLLSLQVSRVSIISLKCLVFHGIL